MKFYIKFTIQNNLCNLAYSLAEKTVSGLKLYENFKRHYPDSDIKDCPNQASIRVDYVKVEVPYSFALTHPKLFKNHTVYTINVPPYSFNQYILPDCFHKGITCLMLDQEKIISDWIDAGMKKDWDPPIEDKRTLWQKILLKCPYKVTYKYE